MPKIDDTLLKSVVYLFGSVDDAQDPNLEDPMRYPQEPGETDAKAASGCLVEVHTKSHRHQYVVTNRHVIQAGWVFPRFSFVDGDVKHGYVLNCVQDDWQYDILKTDLAILPVRDKKVEARISDLAALTALGYTLTRRSTTISPPGRGGG